MVHDATVKAVKGYDHRRRKGIMLLEGVEDGGRGIRAVDEKGPCFSKASKMEAENIKVVLRQPEQLKTRDQAYRRQRQSRRGPSDLECHRRSRS